jgi:hypothetical protein
MLILVKCVIFILYRKSNLSEKFDSLCSDTFLNLDHQHLMYRRIKDNDKIKLRSRVLLEKLLICWLVKTFPAFYDTRAFIPC